MRKLYKYQLIKYYPNINSDEFINIGFIIDNQMILIKENDINHILCWTKKDELKKMLKTLKKETKLSSWYNNYIVIDKKINLFRSDKSINEITDILYYDYIGYKIHHKEAKNIIEIEKENTINLINKEFKNYIQIEKNPYFDIVFVTKSNKIYADIGSIKNKEHINRAIWNTNEFMLSNPNIKSDFLSISQINQDSIPYILLENNNINPVNFYSNDYKYNYLKQLVS